MTYIYERKEYKLTPNVHINCSPMQLKNKYQIAPKFAYNYPRMSSLKR